MKRAILLGASGMVGSALLNQLVADREYEKIVALVRKKINIENSKVEQQIIDFDRIESYKKFVVGDVLFSSLGTTIKKAGSKKNQYKVDYTYQYQVANAAAENGVKHYVLVSSAGANPKSKIFYSRIKGELDAAISKLSFNYISILRPSILDGIRKEQRSGEQITLKIMKTIMPYIPYFRKYRPVHADIVAGAMRNAVGFNSDKYRIYELEQIFNLAKRH